MRNILLFSLLTLCIFSCGDPAGDIPGVIDETQYLPLNVGSEWVYQLDSITYDDLGATIRNESGLMRERVLSVEPGLAIGDSTFTLEVSFRKDDTQQWGNEKIIQIDKTAQDEFLKLEDNLLFKPLVAPLTDSLQWDDLLFDSEDVFEIVEGELINPYQFWKPSKFIEKIENYQLFNDSLVTAAIISDVDNDLPILARRFSESTYGLGVGLVKREKWILDTDCFNVNEDCEGFPWEEKAYKGYIVSQQLISYDL